MIFAPKCGRGRNASDWSRITLRSRTARSCAHKLSSKILNAQSRKPPRTTCRRVRFGAIHTGFGMGKPAGRNQWARRCFSVNWQTNTRASCREGINEHKTISDNTDRFRYRRGAGLYSIDGLAQDYLLAGRCRLNLRCDLVK